MDPLPLHPQLVHLPVALAVLMPLLSSGVLFAWWRGWFRQRTWVVVLAAQALLVASGFVAMRTGEADEDRVEHVVAHAAIERHEEAAEVFQWGASAVLVLCILPVLLRRRPLARSAALAACVGSVTVLGLAYRVGEAGGDLVYRHGAAAAHALASDGDRSDR